MIFAQLKTKKILILLQKFKGIKINNFAWKFNYSRSNRILILTQKMKGEIGFRIEKMAENQDIRSLMRDQFSSY